MIGGDVISAIGNLGINVYNNDENQALQQYTAGLSLKQQQEMQQKMLSLQTEAQKRAYTDSLVDKAKAEAKRKKNIPYYIAGGVLLLTIGITLLVVFSKKDV